MPSNPVKIRRRRRWYRHRRSPTQRAVRSAITIIEEHLSASANNMAQLRRALVKIQENEKMWAGFKALETAARSLGHFELG